jgi:hypothetical protein
MGEFEHSGSGGKKGMLWAIYDIFTIAIIFALIGYLIVEFFWRRL